MRWTRAARLTNRADADGEVVWFRRPDAGVKSVRRSAGDGVKQAWSPRRARRKPLKPLRGECRAESGEPVVTTLVCFVFYRTRGCGCIGHPAFPAPSDFSGRKFLQKPGCIAPRDRESASRRVSATDFAAADSAL